MITQFGQEGIVYVGLKIIGVESRCSGACDFSLTIISLCGGRGCYLTLTRHSRLPGLNKILIRLIPHSLMDVLKLVSPN